jgi:hypothetical protein
MLLGGLRRAFTSISLLLAIAPCGAGSDIWAELRADQPARLNELLAENPVISGSLVPGYDHGAIEWDLQINDPAIEEITLRWSGLPADAYLSVDTQPMEGAEIPISNRRSIITGVPQTQHPQSPIQAVVEVTAADLRTDRMGQIVNEAVTILQKAGGVVVNRWTLNYEIVEADTSLGSKAFSVAPASGETTSDVVVLNDPQSVVLIKDGRDGRCAYREPILAAEQARVTSTSTSVCQPEVAVFSKLHRAELHEILPRPPAQGSVHIQLSAPVPVAVHIWLLHRSAYVQARAAVCAARNIYARNRVGIDLQPVFHHLYADRQWERARTLIGATCEAGEAALDTLRALGWYEPGQLNAYFTRGSNSVRCNKDWNMMYVEDRADWDTLAHEIGHALALPQERSGDRNNLMYATSHDTCRDGLTLRQVYQMNFDKLSRINANDYGHGRAERNCTDACPPTDLRWPAESK